MELLFSLSECYEIEDTYIYIAYKRNKSETPSAFIFFGKFPQNLDLQKKRNILLQNPFLQLKTRQFFERENF